MENKDSYDVVLNYEIGIKTTLPSYLSLYKVVYEDNELVLLQVIQ